MIIDGFVKYFLKLEGIHSKFMNSKYYMESIETFFG